METRKLLLCAVAAGLAVASRAEIVTPNLATPRLNGNVSNAFPGLALRKLVGPFGVTSYAATENSAYKSPCTSYAACGYLSPAYSIGGNLFSAMDYRDCYNYTQSNGTTFSCYYGFEVLQATFTNPTDFVEFQFTWQSDPPGIFGYDEAGNEILACMPSGATGSPAGCMTSYVLSPSGDSISTIRLSSPTAVIKRVVAGSLHGSSRLIGLQYNNL